MYPTPPMLLFVTNFGYHPLFGLSLVKEIFPDDRKIVKITPLYHIRQVIAVTLAIIEQYLYYRVFLKFWNE